MAARRRRSRKGVSIISEGGNILVESPSMSARYRSPFWFVQVNPKLVFPCFRRDNKKIIYVNDKRVGKACYRYTCIPLESYIYDGNSLSDKLANLLRLKLGLCCDRHERGYFRVRLKQSNYIVLLRHTAENNIFCQIYCEKTSQLMGTFTFDKEMQNVYPKFGVDNWVNSMYVIIGYIAGVTVYDVVVKHLTRTINIVI